MRQSAFIRLTGFLALILIIGIAGCGGGSSTPTTTAPTITVAPATLSLNFGQVVQLTPTMLDASGTQVFTPTPVYSSNNSNITVSTGGLVCAGTWDSLTTPIVCTPTAQTIASATITVTAGTLTATVPTSVHSRIARVTVTGTAACTSQTATQQFTAHAFDASNVDITASAGTFTFASADSTIATIDAATGLATSVMPGSTTISASVNNIFSLPATFVACSPASIVLSPTTFSGAAGASQQLTATVTDTNGNAITGAALTYSSSQPVVASVSSAGLISAIAAGSTGIVASCTPPTCNPGANIPVYSNLVSASVTGTSATTVYATGANATTIVPIDTATNVAGTAITIPLVNSLQPVIKSMAFDKLGSKLYIGSDQGLLVLDVATNTIGTPITVPGNVLAVSPDGKKVIVSDQTPTAPHTYIVDTASSSASSLGISTISTAANFPPDSLKAYIVSSSSPTLTVYSPSFPTKVLTINAPANDVTFLTQGSLGYMAGGTASSITARSSCDNSALTNPVATTATPLRIASSFDSTRVFAIDGSNMYDITVSSIATAPSTNCPVTATNSLNAVSFGNTFTPVQLILTSDASRAFVTNNLNKLMVYNSKNSTASTITLSNGATSSTTGGTTLDNLQLYVGALGSNDVHRIDVAAGTDAQQIAVGLKDSTGAATSPDFVAVRPK